MSEEHFSAATAAKAQIEETQRASEETHAAERKRLEEALQVSEEHLSVLIAAKAQIEETQRASEETHTAERKRLEEAVKVSEERLSALIAAKARSRKRNASVRKRTLPNANGWKKHSK